MSISRVTPIQVWNRKRYMYVLQALLSLQADTSCISLFSVTRWVTLINEKFYLAEFRSF